MVPEKQIRGGWLDPRSKLNEKQSTIGTHEAVVYGPMIDWKKKNRPLLHVGRVWHPSGVTPLKCLFTIILY